MKKVRKIFKRRNINSVAYFILALIIAGITFLPFYWAISLSIRNPIETFTVTGLAIPFIQYKPTLKNWKEELATGETQKALLTSTIIATGTAIAVIILGTPAAYAIARFRFRKPSNGNIIMWFLSQRVFPPVLTVIPFFLIMLKLKLLDTILALIIVNITFNLPFVVILMRQAFLDLPIELEEAALVDGAGFFTIFWKISLKLAAPSLAAAVLIVFAFTWNEFLFALTIGTINVRTIPVLMSGAVDTRGIQFWFVAVRTLIAVSPPVILALFAQRFIVRGLSFGGVKG
ncbi:MAG: carbohydrate ABC transporter permease [Candidatus Humimicrobiaceae bacterium]